MSSVVRLVTSVDVDGDAGHNRRMSISARHEAELADGRRVLLLDDRGWSSSGPPDIWSFTTVQDVIETARTVAGPDEPPEGLSPSDMDDDHWAELVRVLARSDVAADASELRQLPHDVEISEELLRRLGRVEGD